MARNRTGEKKNVRGDKFLRGGALYIIFLSSEVRAGEGGGVGNLEGASPSNAPHRRRDWLGGGQRFFLKLFQLIVI